MNRDTYRRFQCPICRVRVLVYTLENTLPSNPGGIAVSKVSVLPATAHHLSHFDISRTETASNRRVHS
jgi:hypothetical protein